MKFSNRTLKIFGEKLSGSDARFYAFAAFLIVVFFTGGGSRDDIQSLLLLRPLAILFCAYAFTVKAPGQWSGRLFPIYIVGALLMLTILQLVPLPPSIWTGLAGRQVFADIAVFAGIEQPWRPLSLSPSQTMNSLFSLTVPIAAIMLYLNLDQSYRKRAVTVIIVLCIISALWSIFQLVGPPRSSLYLYRISNYGAGVGLFSNRNHQAVLLATAVIMLGWYAGCQKPNIKMSTLRYYGSIAMIIVCVPLIFVTGSRAGLLLMAPGLILAMFFIYFGQFSSRNPAQHSAPRKRKANPTLSRRGVFFASIFAVVGIAILSVIFSRSLAYDRLFGEGGIGELRIQVLPTLLIMVGEYMPWGSGFGSFESVYKIYEPLELLGPNYLNQAHNDWVQFLIEGGAAAILLAAVAIGWFLRAVIRLAKSWKSSRNRKYHMLMCVGVIVFLLAASLGDYPLRVPLIMAIFAVFACMLNDGTKDVQLNETNQR
ncbi:MAG: O-antigen ligase family protein [Parasphingorhabdus sp.]